MQDAKKWVGTFMFLRCKTCSSINTRTRDGERERERERERDFSLAYTCLAREECGRFVRCCARRVHRICTGDRLFPARRGRLQRSLPDLAAAREFVEITARDNTQYVMCGRAMRRGEVSDDVLRGRIKCFEHDKNQLWTRKEKERERERKREKDRENTRVEAKLFARNRERIDDCLIKRVRRGHVEIGGRLYRRFGQFISVSTRAWILTTGR